MEPARVRCVLDVVDGPSRRVGPRGVLIGRQGDCDIVARDPSVSRRHALVRLTADGAELVPLGKAPVDVNGTPVERPRALADGDELGVPGLTLRVAISLPSPDAAPIAGFVLERERGGSFGIGHTPFAVGGGERDDLIVKRWPPRTFALHVAQGELFLQACDGPVARNGVALDPDATEPLAAGDVIACRDERFVVRVAGPDPTTNVAGGALPRRIEIEMLPRGGRVVFVIGEASRTVYLADRRFDLVVALVRPPGLAAGDWVSDDALRSVVWPRKPSVSRPEINMLISRCRRDLLEAGLAGPRLIERAPRGGGTRLVISPGAEIVLRT